MSDFQIKSFLNNKKYQWIAVLVLLLAIIVWSASIRTQNLPLLHDSTTGKWLSADIDPFYWLRMANTILSGNMPSYDTFRNPALHVAWSTELMPRVLVFMYKVAHTLGINAPMELISILSPVILFILILAVYFLFVYVLTKSRITSLISTLFLAFVPIFLYRTTAGVGDHDPLGELTFFIALAVFALAFIFINKAVFSKKSDVLKALGLSLASAFLTAFAIAGQPGSSTFLIMIIPLSFLVFWFLKSQKLQKEEATREDKKDFGIYLAFYAIWAICSALFSTIYGNSLGTAFRTLFSGAYGTINLAVLGFIFVDFLVIFFLSNSEKLRKYRPLISLLIILVLGAGLSLFAGKNIISSSLDGLITVINPSALDSNRVGSTVSENAQPYLTDLIGQIGAPFFWIFFLGVVISGFVAAKEIKTRKNQIVYSILWVFFASAVLLTRYDGNSMFNGTNFISMATYLVGALLFLGFCVWLYFKDEIKTNPMIILLASWTIFSLISARATARIYFVIAPYICFMAAYGLIKIFNFARTIKDDTYKTLAWIVFAAVIVGLAFSVYSFVGVSSTQTKYIGPSANVQWQEAMNWTRANTPADAIFVHWWDYGWWTQTLGERRTVTDGGHANGYWDHLVARYLLTTTKPEIALSYMKSNNVSYLLLDPSDIGKYPAYAKIGSDSSGVDRFDQISTFVMDSKQTVDTANGTYYVLTGGAPLFDDVIINNKLLAKERTGVGAFVISSTGGQISGINAVLVSNGAQINLPINCVAYNEQVRLFAEKNSTLPGCLYLVPSVDNTGKVNPIGAALWLDQKTFSSLFVQLYLFKGKLYSSQYQSAFTQAYFADDPVVSFFKTQQSFAGDIIYYQGLRAPLEIWKINYPANILSHSEFLSPSGDYAGLDNLQFTK